jgi:hypothetical protein
MSNRKCFGAETIEPALDACIDHGVTGRPRVLQERTCLN